MVDNLFEFSCRMNSIIIYAYLLRGIFNNELIGLKYLR
jgi:hypothetical protein